MSNARSGYLNLCVLGAMLMWLKTLSFLKVVSVKYATFVLMLERTLRDIQPFCVVLAVFLFAFGTVFHLRLNKWQSDRFDFHDDGEENPFRSVPTMLQALVMLAFVGEFDSETYPRGADIFWLDLFIFVMIVIMLNVLIAIVCDSYSDAIAHGDRLFWRARLEQLTEIRTVWGKSLLKLGFVRTKPGDVLDILRAEFENDVAEETKAENLSRRIIRALRIIRGDVASTTTAMDRIGDLSTEFNARMDGFQANLEALDAKFDKVLALAEARTRAIMTTGAHL